MKKWLVLGVMLCSALVLTLHFKKDRVLHLNEVAGDWRQAAIEKQLAPFAKGSFTRDQLRAYPRSHVTYLYEIDQGQLRVVPPEGEDSFGESRNKVLEAVVNRILAVKPLPDMTFLLHVGDYSIMDREDKVPMLVFSKSDCKPFDIMIPDFEMFTLDRKLWKPVLKASKKHRWGRKQSVAFWRGSTSGGDFAGPYWKQFPRAQMMALTKKAHGLINAQFTAHLQGADRNPEFLAKMGSVGQKVSVGDHLAYKYLIDIDGNASTYSRYFWILLSNSVPIKVVSHFSQWYYEGLVPFEHYVPVAYDCSDLIEQISWAEQHEKKAYQIAKASQAFALKYLSEEGVYTYLYHLLNCYSEVVK